VPDFHNNCYTCRLNGFNYCSSEDMCYDDIAAPCVEGVLLTQAYEMKACGYEYRCDNVTVSEHNSPVYGGSSDWKSYTFNQDQSCLLAVRNFMPLKQQTGKFWWSSNYDDFVVYHSN